MIAIIVSKRLSDTRYNFQNLKVTIFNWIVSISIVS